MSDLTLLRQEEWPPTFTDETTTLFVGREAYEEMGKPAQVTVTVVASDPEPAEETPEAEPEPEVPVGGADGPTNPTVEAETETPDA